MEEVVILAKKGDKEAFSRLIDYIKVDLYKIAKSRLQSEDDISDVIQETIICAYKSISKLKEPKNFKKWLITILVNKCKDSYKKKKQNSCQVALEEVNEVYAFAPKEFENIEISDILKNLNEDERLIITLYYLEDYTSKEIADILGMNENTIKTKVLRAKNKIRNSFKGGIYFG